VAVPGYCLFGNAAQPSAVRNIGVDLAMAPLPDLGWMNAVAALGIRRNINGVVSNGVVPKNQICKLVAKFAPEICRIQGTCHNEAQFQMTCVVLEGLTGPVDTTRFGTTGFVLFQV